MEARIDKWLWAARIYKTRSLAADACKNGRVTMGGAPCKPSRTVKEGGSSDTTVLGTTGFAAPEQYGIGQSDARADIYALGTLMNVMLTGRHPSVEMAPGRFGRIVKKCTMVNPDDRYKDITRLMEAL